MKKTKLQKILNKLQEGEVYRNFNDKVAKAKSNLEESLALESLDKISEYISQFKGEDTLRPIIDSVEDLRKYFDSQKEILLKKLEDATTRLETGFKFSRDTSDFDALNSEVEDLKRQLKDIENKDTGINALNRDIHDLQLNFLDRFDRLSTKIDAKDILIQDAQVEISDVKVLIEKNKRDITERINNLGGGAINRQIRVEGVDALTKFNDINFYGINASIITSLDNTNKVTNIGIPSGGGGGTSGSGTTNQVAYWGAPSVVAGDNGLTYNTSILTITNDALGSNASDTKGFALVNTTDATSLLNQVSPAIKLKGNGWKTNATAGSQSVAGRIYLNVLTGTANPQGAIRLQTALNGGSFSNHVFDIWTDGIVSIEEGGPFPSGYAKLQIPSINITTGGSIRLAESKGASGQFLGSDGTKTIWATPTMSLSNGSATTANGSAVDLGGLATGNIAINMASFNIQFVGGNLNSDPNDFLTYGTYTPTWNDETNTSSITGYPCQWMRVGNTVTVSGKVDITANSANTDTQARATLPVSTTLGNDYELAGAFNCGEASGGTVPAPSGVCFANTTRSELMVKFFPIDTDSHSYFFTYTYQVIIV